MLMGSPDSADLSMSPATDPEREKERERDGVEINRGRVFSRFLLARLEYKARENNAAWESNVAFQQKKKDRSRERCFSRRKSLSVYRCHIFGNS